MKDLNNISDEEFEELFRAKDAKHNEELWDDAWPTMREKLKKEEKKRRFIFWWSWAAAVLFIGAIGLFSLNYFNKDANFKDQTDLQTKKEIKAEKGDLESSKDKVLNNEKLLNSEIRKEKEPKEVSESRIISKNNGTNSLNTKNSILKKSQENNNIVKAKEGIQQKITFENKLSSSILNNSEKDKGKNLDKGKKRDFENEKYPNQVIVDTKQVIVDTKSVLKSDVENQEKSEIIANQKDTVKETETVAKNLKVEEPFFIKDTLHVVSNLEPLNLEIVKTEISPKNKSNKSPFRKFEFILGLSPDYSKVTQSSFGTLGYNFQFLINYNFTNKLALQTGIIKSLKVYDAYPENYVWPERWGTPSSPLKEINATCKMLDIPINIIYKFYEKGSNKVYTGVGITSYKMLNEKYIYHYENDADPNIKRRQWQGNSGFFGAGILNLSLGVEHKISKRLSMQLEPFFKVPIKNVGFGSVKLYTTGLFLNIKTNSLN